MSASSESTCSRIHQRPTTGDLGADLLACISENPSISDVTLIGTDGGEGVPAVRFILAARSSVFEKMLLGEFREATSDTVELSFPTVVLRGVVEYCCSDHITAFKEYVEASDLSFEEHGYQRTREAVQICAAADFFELKKLQKLGQEVVQYLIDVLPCRACAVWDESLRDESLKYPSLVKIQSNTLDSIRSNAWDCLITGFDMSYQGSYVWDPKMGGMNGIKMLSAENLALLVEDGILAAEANVLFGAIIIWAAKSESMGIKERWEVAKKCAAKIELRLIPPKDILGYVQESSLVDPEKMMKILTYQSKCPGVFLYGAGLPSVNGMYEKTGEDVLSNESYEKAGRLDGEDVNFTIYRAQNSWWIGAPPKGEDKVRGTSDDRHIYKRKDEEKTWWESEWETCDNQDVMNPAPKIRSLIPNMIT